MHNAIILHGMPEEQEYYDPGIPAASNDHWLPWLQKQLIMHGIPTQTPEIPQAFRPEYQLWKREFERYDITPHTILVGHSCGGGFLIRWLSEHKDITVNKVVLVAPWLGFGWNASDFFDFTIDPNIADRTAGLTIFESDNDDSDIIDSIQQCRSSLNNVVYRTFSRYGHFCLEDMGTPEFPELLQEVLTARLRS